MLRLLLTPAEAAAALGISRSKLYRLIRAGRLQSVLLDGSRRVPLSALQRLVDELSGVTGVEQDGVPSELGDGHPANSCGALGFDLCSRSRAL